MIKFIEPEENKAQEIADVIVMTLGRELTDYEISTNMKETFKSIKL